MISGHFTKTTRIPALILFVASVAFTQENLTDDSVVKMVKAGLSDGLIVNMIQTQPGRYSFSTDDLVRLKGDGVSEKIPAAMISKGSGASTPASATNSSARPEGDLPQNMDIGVYYKNGAAWKEMQPEIVNWKTGGVLKTVATVGVVKGDVNGHIDGAASKNDAGTPMEVIIYAPEGVAITEYQLVHLHIQKDSREFRTLTGGIVHVSGGATRDLVPFDSEKVTSRTFKVLLPHLASGEYGFLPPGAFGASNGASIGKLYTLHILE